MKKSHAILSLLLLTTGCASTSKVSDANTSELFQVVRQYSACVRDNATRLDDHVAPIDLIGAEVASACRKEYEATNAVALLGVEPEEASVFLAERKRTAVKTPTNVVKAMRAMQMAQNTIVIE